MTELSWTFSNAKPSTFETQLQFVGSSAAAMGPMPDQEKVPFMGLSQGSSGSLMVQGQYPLPYDFMFNGMLQMDRDDYSAAQSVWGIQRTFDNDCHV